MLRACADRPGSTTIVAVSWESPSHDGLMDTSDAVIAAPSTEVGPRLKRARTQRGLTLTALAEHDRHLQEHAVAARERPTPPEPRAAPAAGAGLPRAARRAGRRARGRRPAIRLKPSASTAAPSSRSPGTPAASRPGRSSSRHRRTCPSCGRTRATSGSTCSPAGCGWSSASHDLVLGPGEVAEFDTAGRTGSAARARSRPRCSASSAATASACTCGRPRPAAVTVTGEPQRLGADQPVHLPRERAGRRGQRGVGELVHPPPRVGAVGDRAAARGRATREPAPRAPTPRRRPCSSPARCGPCRARGRG